MLCPKCGYYSDREESVCPECGNILQYSSGIPKEGPQAIRQGKRAREAGRTRQEPSPKETAGRHARGSASRGAIRMPTVRDTRKPSDPDADEAAELTGDDTGFERRRRTRYDENADEDTALKYLSSHEGSALYYDDPCCRRLGVPEKDRCRPALSCQDGAGRFFCRVLGCRRRKNEQRRY